MNRFGTQIPLALLLVCIAANLALAADERGISTMGTELAPYFRMLWGLFIVLGIMLVVYGIVRKRFSVLGGNSSDRIKILEIKPVMPKKALCLVKVKGKEYLIGIAGESITLLADTGPEQGTTFQEVLEQSGEGSQ